MNEEDPKKNKSSIKQDVDDSVSYLNSRIEEVNEKVSSIQEFLNAKDIDELQKKYLTGIKNLSFILLLLTLLVTHGEFMFSKLHKALPSFDFSIERYLRRLNMKNKIDSFKDIPGIDLKVKKGDSIAGYKVTDTFLPCTNPVVSIQDCRVWGYPRPHNGVDLATKQGTPIYAPGPPGKKVKIHCAISRKGINKGAGQYLYAQISEWNMKVLVAHLQKGKCHTSNGYSKEAKVGQIIGRTGNTGDSTGPHAHIGVKILKENKEEYNWTHPTYAIVYQTLRGSLPKGEPK